MWGDIGLFTGKTRGKRADETGQLKKKKKTAEIPETAPELIVKPRRQFVDDGEDAKFKAGFDGPDNTTVVWSKDGKTLSEDGHYKIYEKDGFHFLEVIKVTSEDMGEFTVTVKNSAGSDTASAELEVFEKPQLLSREVAPSWEKALKDVTSHVGDDGIELACASKDLKQPSVQWFHNGKEVFSGFHMKVQHEGQSTSLVVKRIRESDEGQFKCVMTGSNGELESSCKLTVRPPEKMEPPVFVKELHDMEVEDGDKLELVVEVKELENPELPHFVIRPSNCIVQEGETTIFTCKVKGQPMPTVVWEREGVEITNSSKHKTSNTKGLHSLTIYNIDTLDKGEYTCHLHNTQGNTSHPFQLFLQSDISLGLNGGRTSTGRISFATPKSTVPWKGESTTGSQTERVERKESHERPRYSHSFTQPKNETPANINGSNQQPIRNSLLRSKFEAPSDQNNSHNALHNSPLFKRAKEKSDFKTHRSIDNHISNGLGDSNVIFGSGTVDFRERERKDRSRLPMTARENGSKNVVENGLRNLQMERNFRNAVSRGGGEYGTGLDNSLWKSDSPKSDFSYSRNGNKSVSPIGLKAVNKSLESLKKQTAVFELSKDDAGQKNEVHKPVYSLSSSLQFSSDEMREITNSALKTEENSKESKDIRVNRPGEVFQAQKKQTNMFAPTEKPFNSTSSEPVLHRARLANVTKPFNNDNTLSSHSSDVSGSDKTVEHSFPSKTLPPTTFDKTTNGEVEPASSKSLLHNSDSNSKVSDEVSLPEKPSESKTHDKGLEFIPVSRKQQPSESENSLNQRHRPVTSNGQNGNGNYTTDSCLESGSVFTWGKRLSQTKDELSQDTNSVSQNFKNINMSSSSIDKSPSASNVNKSNIDSLSVKSTESSSVSDEVSDFRSIKLKPTKRKENSDLSSSNQLRKSKFMSKSTENVFADVKLRPISKDSGDVRPTSSDFSPRNVGRLRLKSKSTNFSDLDISSNFDEKENNKVTKPITSKALEDLKSNLKATTSTSNVGPESKIGKTVQSKKNDEVPANKKNTDSNKDEFKSKNSENENNEIDVKQRVRSRDIDNSKPSEFMEKVRKWKTTSDFTVNDTKTESSGAQIDRVSTSGSQTARASPITSRQGAPVSPGSSHLDSVPEWVKQKALNKRNSLQSDKMSTDQTYRASLINTGDFSNSKLGSSTVLNKTFHSFDRNGFDVATKDKNLNSEPQTSNGGNDGSAILPNKTNILPQNEKLKLSARLGHQRSVPDLKEKSKYENKSSDLDWMNRKPRRNIEQMIKAQAESKIDKKSKDDEKPEWTKIKSPREMKPGGFSTVEVDNKGVKSSLSKFNFNSPGSCEKHTTQYSSTKRETGHKHLLAAMSSPNLASKFENEPESNRNRKIGLNALRDFPSTPPVKSKFNQDVETNSLSKTSSPSTRNPDVARPSAKSDQESTPSQRKLLSDKTTNIEKTSSQNPDTSIQHPILSQQSSSSSSSSSSLSSSSSILSSECKIISTPPTPMSETKDIAALSSKKSATEGETPEHSTKDQSLSTREHPTPVRGSLLQKQSLSLDQPPLKATPVRPSWMKQKSLRHIPIYPINDNELSPRYEPFRKSMDDTSSTNSVSSLASDASGLTTDSGYGKSVLTEDSMNISKENLLDRANLDIEPEEASFGGDSKTGSNDNVFNLASSDVDADTDSGFCPESDGRNGEDKDIQQISSLTESKVGINRDNLKTNSNLHKETLPQSNVPPMKESIHIDSCGSKSRLRPHDKENNDLKVDNIVQESKTKNNNGLTTIQKEEDFPKPDKNKNGEIPITSTYVPRTVKSEFLRKRLLVGQSEDASKETTNCSMTNSPPRRLATRPSELNIPSTLGFGMRNRSNGLGVEKNNSSSGLSSVSSKQKDYPVPRDVLVDRNNPSTEINADESKETSPRVPDETCPTFITPLNDMCVTYGSKAVLRCYVKGVPTPEIQWLHDRKPVEQSKATTSSFSSSTGLCTLTVIETFTDHIGTYSCLASNSAGSVTTSARLTIATSKKSDGLAIEGPVSLPPRVISLTPKVVTLTRQTTLKLTLTFVGEPTPTVSWKLGEKELVDGDGRVSIETEKGSSRLTIDQVTGMDTGKVTAVLTSAIGSDHTTANICVEDVPGAPVGKPHIYGINRESASLSWCGPSDSGGCNVCYYVIEAKLRQQTTWDVLVPQCKDLSYHIFGLKPSSTYQFRVRAANKEGLGPPSEPSERVITSDPFSPSFEDESDGNCDVFTPTVEYRRADELPFEPRDVQMNATDKFEDHYDLGPVVGKGKFGVVYKCTQKSDNENRTWAAKVLKCREKDKAAIRQEVAIMNLLRHPKLLMLWDAFESPRQMVLVMEFIGAGELFERVIGEDFVLTERDCVHFVRQICEGVSYMHSSHVLHLDLKPENILCIAENSNRIKIIDFGLARFFKPGDSTKVLLGTPEFIAPEVINYDEIGFGTDMWSIGVICYVLLSGLSPFLGDNDAETLSNVTMGDFDFDDEAFDEISDEAKNFISKLLIKRKEKRLLTDECVNHTWLAGDEVDGMRYKRLNTDRLKHFMVRRKWLKTGNAVLAVSRLMKTTSLSSFSNRSGSSSSVTDVATTPDAVEENDVNCATTSSEPLPTEGVKNHIDSNNSKPENCFILKDQNDNKLVSMDAAKGTGSEKNEKSGNSLPLIQNGSENPSSTCKNHNGDPAVSMSIHKSQTDSQTCSTALLSSSLTPTVAASNNSSTTSSSSSSSSSTLCPSLPSITSSTSQAPCFTKEMSDSQAFVGDIVRFDVAMTGVPFPQVVWYFEEEELSADSKYSIESNESKGTCSLIIRSINDDDDGEYTCKAVNFCGEAVCSGELSVLEI